MSGANNLRQELFEPASRRIASLPFLMDIRLSFMLSRPSRWYAALLLACISGLAGGFAQSQSPEQTQPSLTYRFTGALRQTHIPFQLNSNHIYVLVRVNGSGPHWFMLDSGSIFDVLDTDVARGLGIQLRGQIEASGSGEKTITGATGANASLAISGLQLKHGEIYVLPIQAALAAADGRRTAGLLGYDFFSHFVLKIDYIRRQIDVFEPSGFRYAGGGEVIPLDIVRGNMLISADLTMPDGKEVSGSFLVDTGWRSALTFASPFVADHKLLESVPKKVEAATGMGPAGPTVGTEARIASLKIGRYEIENLVADFSHAKAGVLSQGDFAGVIGGEVLRRFTVTLDYPHHRMIIEPNAMFAAPYDIDMSGLFLISDGNSAAFKVYGVVRNSPAAQAGIQEGDVIQGVDGSSASNFTLEEVRQMFKKAEGQEHQLAIRRDGKVFTTKIRLRRII